MTDLYPSQILALRKLANGKVLWGGTGSGKTPVAAHYYKENEAPRDVYVITTARKRDSFDWQDEFYELGIGPATGPHDAGNRLEDSRPDVQGRGNISRGISPADPGDLGDGRDHAGVAVRGKSTVRHRGAIGGVDASDGVRPHISRTGMGSDQIRGSYPDDLAVDDNNVGGDQGAISSGFVDLDTGSGSSGEAPWEAGKYPYVLTVDSWNNIAKYADVAGAFFIFDEQRLVGAGDWVRKFLRISKRNRWILLTATPGDTWMDYVPIFIANGFYKNRTEFKREHVVYNTFTKFPKIDRYINQGRLARQRSQLLVEMVVERHTKRRHVETMLPYDKVLLDRVLKDRWHIYEDRPLNDVGEMFLVARKVVNSDPSRLEMVKELWKTHPRLIVFYNFNYELEMLRSLKEQYEIANGLVPSGIGNNEAVLNAVNPGRQKTSSVISQPSGFPAANVGGSGSEWKRINPTSSPGSRKNSTKLSQISITNGSLIIQAGLPSPSGKPSSLTNHFVDTGIATSSKTSGSEIAEWNGHKHQPVPSSSHWIYLVQYTAGAEAWNCIETDTMIMFSQNYSWKIMEQAYGRIDRINTPFTDLWYYGFTSNSFIDQAIARSLKAKETFNEAKYKGMFQS